MKIEAVIGIYVTVPETKGTAVYLHAKCNTGGYVKYMKCGCIFIRDR